MPLFLNLFYIEEANYSFSLVKHITTTTQQPNDHCLIRIKKNYDSKNF